MVTQKKPEKVKENPDENLPEFIIETTNALMNTGEKLAKLKNDPVWQVAETIDKTEGLLGDLAKNIHKKLPNKIPPYPYKREGADV